MLKRNRGGGREIREEEWKRNRRGIKKRRMGIDGRWDGESGSKERMKEAPRQ